MKKKYGIIAVMLLLIMQCTPSCMVIGVRDDFADNLVVKEDVGTFIPYLYVQHNALRISLVLLWIEIDRLPHSVVMLLTPLKTTDEGFSSFVLNDVSIQFADGTRVNCIDPSLPQAQRTYTVSDAANWNDRRHIFDDVIIKRMDFTVHTSGRAITADGTPVPFKRKTQYTYNGKDATFHTLVDAWGRI